MDDLKAKLEEQLAEIAPEDWHNIRYLPYIPDHFIQCKMPADEDVGSILPWLLDNTSGRYAIAAPTEQLDGHRNFWVQRELLVGFEDPKEATLFTLVYS